MRRFLIKISVAASLALALHLIAGYFADGLTDPYYLKFTGNPPSSLVIGTSRASQAIVPERFAALFHEQNFEGPMMNFSFTALSSPYGEVYLRAIQKKINPQTKNGLFIVAVDPYSLAEAVPDAVGKKPALPETKGALYHTRTFNSTPNYEYLLRNYNHGWGYLWFQHIDLFHNETVLQPDGWLRIDVPMDSVSIAKRSKGKIENHRKSIGMYTLSPMRLQYLEETIRFLQQHGEVYLLRLPVSSVIYDIEKDILPGFEEAVQEIAAKTSVPYRNMNDQWQLFQYKDGHHMGKESALACSDSLVNWIRLTRNVSRGPIGQ